MKKKVAVITGTRAEYGLLYWTMKEIQKSGSLELQLIVTGTHLSQEFGNTYKLIEQDGFSIDKKVDMLISNDTPIAISKSMGIGMIGFAHAFEELKPDIILVLGDRFEILAAVSAALPFNIPIAHIHGGETTEGAIDEQIRHAITKMAHLHFASTETYAQNVIKMGEEKWRVYNLGAPGLEWLKKAEPISKSVLEEELGINFYNDVLLATFHPVTLEKENSEEYIENLIDELIQLGKQVIFTSANSDTCGIIINEKIKQAASKYSFIKFVKNLGQLRYLSCLNYCAAMVGNSSSGIIEAASFGLPVLNIGNRQKGRIRGDNVVDVGYSKEEIFTGLKKVLSPDFRKSLANIRNPYGNGHFSKDLVRCLTEVNIGRPLLLKKLVFSEN